MAQGGPAGVLLDGASAFVFRLAKVLASVGVQVLVSPLGREVDPDEARGVTLYRENMLLDLNSTEPSELDGVDSVLLMSDSDELNTVLATDLGGMVGRGDLYQLAPEDPDASGRGSFFERAPVLFDRRATHAALSRRIEAGATISVITIEDGAADGPGVSGMPLFVLTPGKRLDVVTADAPARPRAGQVVISLESPS